MPSKPRDAGELTTDGVEVEMIAGSELTWASGSATEVEVELAVGPKLTGARMAADVEVELTIDGAGSVACISSGHWGPVEFCKTSWSLE